jgi:hypothetical protein
MRAIAEHQAPAIASIEDHDIIHKGMWTQPQVAADDLRTGRYERFRRQGGEYAACFVGPNQRTCQSHAPLPD